MAANTRHKTYHPACCLNRSAQHTGKLIKIISILWTYSGHMIAWAARYTVVYMVSGFLPSHILSIGVHRDYTFVALKRLTFFRMTMKIIMFVLQCPFLIHPNDSIYLSQVYNWDNLYSSTICTHLMYYVLEVD